ncbi:MAG: AAA family ATPase [Bacteroidales bacterium]|nr:AAA family ATPase [Bacteroidales bacterium]
MESTAKNKIRLIPYGMSDFARIRRENRYYVDKTMFIPRLEEFKYQTFLRPRRYGKSLMLNMLAAYYDVAYKDQFDELFGGLYIGEHPTEECNKYLILKFDFSKVDPDYTKTQSSFNELVLSTLRTFAEKYAELLPKETVPTIKAHKNSNDAFTELLNLAQLAGQQIYAIIDEYDNFANTLLADSENNYRDLTHGDGFFRLFFNNLKACTNGNDAAVSRIMISGVTPLTLSDVTSGYNIGDNISTNHKFNSFVGFTETEYRQMLEYYRDATGIFKHTVDQLIEITKPWYDNNCFSIKSVGEERMYNSDMGLYFIKNYIQNGGEIPEKMVDKNVKTDYNKMVALIRFEKNFGEKTSLIQRINNDGQIYAQIEDEFALQDLDKYENLVSLMYYMGLLSIGGYDTGDTLLIVPNATVRQQYFKYLKQSYKDFISWKTDDNVMTDLGRGLAKRGEPEPFFRYISSCMGEVSNVKDFNDQGEAFVKGFFLCQFGTNLNYFVAFTEHYFGHGYTDLYLKPRFGTPHAYLIELKYVKHSATDAEVKAKLEEACSQLPKYVNDKNLLTEAKDGNWTLHPIILVFKGWELAEYKNLPL